MAEIQKRKRLPLLLLNKIRGINIVQYKFPGFLFLISYVSTTSLLEILLQNKSLVVHLATYRCELHASYFMKQGTTVHQINTTRL